MLWSYKCETTLQRSLSAFSVHECEQRLAQEIGINSAERTAGTSKAKLNTLEERRGEKRQGKTCNAPNCDISQYILVVETPEFIGQDSP